MRRWNINTLGRLAEALQAARDHAVIAVCLPVHTGDYSREIAILDRRLHDIATHAGYRLVPINEEKTNETAAA